jgi:diguanylate cyclase (GGDEF)-like protein
VPIRGPGWRSSARSTPRASSPRDPPCSRRCALFFGIALLFIVLLVRGLQGQVAAMLGAAQRIGAGDFSRELPVEGRDEMAGLAREFNKMSDRLAEQMAVLRRQRAELERSVQRIGEAFAHGLDREALLDIVAEVPETGPVGGLEAAERIRHRIEAAEIPRVDGSGGIRVTASLGVASMPEAARDMTSLIAAADSALYRAKSSGKNRSEQATANEQPSWWVAAQGPATERRT